MKTVNLSLLFLFIGLSVFSQSADRISIHTEVGDEVSYYCKMKSQTLRTEDMIINFINSTYE